MQTIISERTAHRTLKQICHRSEGKRRSNLVLPVSATLLGTATFLFRFILSEQVISHLFFFFLKYSFILFDLK